MAIARQRGVSGLQAALGHAISCETRTRLSRWKKRAFTVAGAHQWLKATELPLWAVRAEEGETVAGRAAA
eukprot:13501165-Alexandrium_andersonii.AAC.1